MGAVKGCLGTIDKRNPGAVARAREGAIVTGVYKGDVDAGSGVALLIGDCTRVEGKDHGPQNPPPPRLPHPRARPLPLSPLPLPPPQPHAEFPGCGVVYFLFGG